MPNKRPPNSEPLHKRVPQRPEMDLHSAKDVQIRPWTESKSDDPNPKPYSQVHVFVDPPTFQGRMATSGVSG